MKNHLNLNKLFQNLFQKNKILYNKSLPDFVIIGAQKASTSTLHNTLSQHPQIFMSQHKEHNLFLADSNEVGNYFDLEPLFYGSSSRKKRGGLTDAQILRRMFLGYNGEAIVGDASPYYTCAPSTSLETPEKMYRMKPDMRIVYLLRNPFQRIISNYNHDVGIHNRCQQPIKEDFTNRIQHRSHFLETSLYFKQLNRYLEFYPARQIHIMIYEELLVSPSSSYTSLLKFLGVDEDFEFKTNYRAKPRCSTIFSRENYKRLIEPIREDITKMESFLARDLSIWDLSEDYWCRGEG